MKDRSEQNIKVKELMERLEEVRIRHDKNNTENNTEYETGFSDGIQQAMNEIVGILDEKE